MLNEFKLCDNFNIKEGGVSDACNKRQFNEPFFNFLKMNIVLDIKQKFNFLLKIKNLKQSIDALNQEVIDRRIQWLESNMYLIAQYKNLPLPEQAYRLIFFDHMNIASQYSQVVTSTENFIIIRSYNFCPYLEACRLLDLDTKFVCKKLCEKPFDRMVKYIHPRLKFSRNYNLIRPYVDYCEEYIELVG